MKSRRGAAAAIALVLLAGRGGRRRLRPPPPAHSDQRARRGRGAQRLEEIQKEAAEKRRRAQILQGKENTLLKDLRATEGKLATTRSSSAARRRARRNSTASSTHAHRLDRSRARSRPAASLPTGCATFTSSGARELGFLSAGVVRPALRPHRLPGPHRAAGPVLLLGITRRKTASGEPDAARQRTSDVERTATRRPRAGALNRLACGSRVGVAIQNQRKEYEAAAAELERTARRIQSLLAELERRRRERRSAPPAGACLRGRAGEAAHAVRGQVRAGPRPARLAAARRDRRPLRQREPPEFGTVTFNNGIDIGAPIGNAVRAVAKAASTSRAGTTAPTAR